MFGYLVSDKQPSLISGLATRRPHGLAFTLCALALQAALPSPAKGPLFDLSHTADVLRLAHPAIRKCYVMGTYRLCASS